MNSNINRQLKRCPKCKSSKIYRRVRAKVWSAKAKDSKGNVVEKFEKLSKAYSCQKCGHEFDKPLILDEIIQDDMNNDVNKDIEEGKGSIKEEGKGSIKEEGKGSINNDVNKDIKEEGKGSIKMEKPTVIRPRVVKIPICDIMEDLVQRVMNEYGVEYSEVKCVTKIKNILFEIPILDDTLCNNVMPAISIDDACGTTKGGCLCGLEKGHEGHCICKRCDEEWETQEDTQE